MTEPRLYCREWNEILRQPRDPIGAEEARRRWYSGENLVVSALWGEPDHPRLTLGCNPAEGTYEAEFYDDLARPWLSFGFVPAGEGMLFLSQVCRREWDSPGKLQVVESSGGELVLYQQDGTVRRSRIKRRPGHPGQADVEMLAAVPLDINWEPVPAWGDWASITRYERDRPAGDSASRWPGT